MSETVSKNANRAQRNFVSAAVMLGHLCALYDRGVFESARLMSNLIFQLAIKRKSNLPLLEQMDLCDLAVVVDDRALSSKSDLSGGSPLAGLLFGFKAGGAEGPVPTASWVPLYAAPGPSPGFTSLSLEQWLDDPVIPTGREVLSRRVLVGTVRDQDGGAHSDTDEKIAKSESYLDLVDSFPMSKQSSITKPGSRSLPWEMLPPYTHALLRQISHELLSAIYSGTDLKEACPLPTLICFFEGDEMAGACVPIGYPQLGPINGKMPAKVTWPPSSNT